MKKLSLYGFVLGIAKYTSCLQQNAAFTYTCERFFRLGFVRSRLLLGSICDARRRLIINWSITDGFNYRKPSRHLRYTYREFLPSIEYQRYSNQ